MNLKKASIRLSFLLRHCKEPCYISLDGGWASVDTMVEVLSQRFPGFTKETLAEIVAEDQKGRYSYDSTGTKIRANQGHSIPGVQVEMESPEPPEYLYHGTATRFLPAILREGLKPMSRQYVHISPDIPTAQVVGRRHGEPVVLRIQARRFAAEGHPLLRSANGVWQAEAVPPEYLEVL